MTGKFAEALPHDDDWLAGTCQTEKNYRLLERRGFD